MIRYSRNLSRINAPRARVVLGRARIRRYDYRGVVAAPVGMVPFSGVLTAEQIDAAHSDVISRVQEDCHPVFGPPPPQR